MEDFYKVVEKSLRDGSMGKLLDENRAHTGLNYQVSDRLVTIPAAAFYEELGNENSLECMPNRVKGRFPYTQDDGEKGVCLATEIAFTGIFDPELLHFYDFVSGDIGNKDMSDWTTGDLLSKSGPMANAYDGEIALGHTHPVIVPDEGPRREYGAIPSLIDWEDEDLVKMIAGHKQSGNELGEWSCVRQLESGISKMHGADYGEMRTLAERIDSISSFGLIMSPALNQLGIFDVKDGGVIVYHPWKIV